MKTREEKFARILAIANLIGERTLESNRPSIEHHYRTKFSRYPAKTLATIHKDLMAYSHRWKRKEWMLYDVLMEEIADLDLDEFNNEDLGEMFPLHLGKSYVEMRNIIGVKVASKILGLTEGTVKNYCAEGRIPAKKIGKTWVLDRNNLEIKQEENTMETVYNNLLNVLDEETMSQDGKYLDYYPSIDKFSELKGWTIEEAQEKLKNEFQAENVEGSFITLEDQSAFGGYIFLDAETAFDDVMNLMKNENSYKKYVN